MKQAYFRSSSEKKKWSQTHCLKISPWEEANLMYRRIPNKLWRFFALRRGSLTPHSILLVTSFQRVQYGKEEEKSNLTVGNPDAHLVRLRSVSTRESCWRCRQVDGVLTALTFIQCGGNDTLPLWSSSKKLLIQLISWEKKKKKDKSQLKDILQSSWQFLLNNCHDHHR